MNYSSYIFKTTVKVNHIDDPSGKPVAETSATFLVEDEKELVVSHGVVLSAATKMVEKNQI